MADPRIRRALLLAALTGSIGLCTTVLPVATALEESLGLDLLLALRGPRPAPADVMVVAIDRESAEALNVPTRLEKWPRTMHARLVDALSGAGAAVIAFDVMFDEPQTLAHDTALARAVSRARNVVLFESLKREMVIVHPAGPPGESDLIVERLVPPIPALSDAAVALAPLPLPKVPTLRQYWKFKAGAGDTTTMPAVAFQLFARDVYSDFVRLLAEVHPAEALTLPPDWAALETRGHVERVIQTLRGTFAASPTLAPRMLSRLERLRGPPSPAADAARWKLAALIRMYDGDDSNYLNLYGPSGTISTMSYHQALTDGSAGRAAASVRGKVVFVGLSERLRPERKDDFHTAFGDLSGVEVAATAFANLLEDRPVRSLSTAAQLITLALWGAAIGALCSLSSAPLGAAATIGASFAYAWAAWYRFSSSAEWWPLVVPLLVQAPLAVLGSLLWKSVETDRERKAVRRAFGFYLPQDEVDRVLRNIDRARTSSRIVYGTCLATDTAGYTKLAEQMDPGELGRLLNEYYAAVFQPVRRHGGIVSDVIGDSVLAIWATSQPDAGLRRQACLAACEVAKAVDGFRHELADRLTGGAGLPTRIGLHSGRMSLGTIGALDHYEFRAVGDIVNTATRIQELNKYLGTRILVSADTLNEIEGFLTRELGTFLMVGKTQPLVLHEVLSPSGEASPQLRGVCGLFRHGLVAYRNQAFDEAVLRFQETLKSRGEDGPSRFYLRLCERARSEPRSESWTSVVRMDAK